MIKVTMHQLIDLGVYIEEKSGLSPRDAKIITQACILAMQGKTLLDMACKVYNGISEGKSKRAATKERMGTGGLGTGNRRKPIYGSALGEAWWGADPSPPQGARGSFSRIRD